VILHPRVGGKPTASMLSHAQVAFIGLALGFIVLHYTAEPLGSWWAMLVGIAFCLAWNGVLLLLRSRSMRRATNAAQASP
jgi:hypothetical protein